MAARTSSQAPPPKVDERDRPPLAVSASELKAGDYVSLQSHATEMVYAGRVRNVDEARQQVTVFIDIAEETVPLAEKRLRRFFQVGEAVKYWSETKQAYFATRVAKIHMSDLTYDLELKPGTAVWGRFVSAGQAQLSEAQSRGAAVVEGMKMQATVPPDDLERPAAAAAAAAPLKVVRDEHKLLRGLASPLRCLEGQDARGRR
eukprot:TRINITY_DN330_c0_g4_i2.p1 TRINITY_DN330_c0_g4~~TRINITY_DN330_c0_g4_i2.p1  ORF type:complete len:203 (+),score=49.32 TRINITY_DN330_c0_g4_i2:270-878(+)